MANRRQQSMLPTKASDRRDHRFAANAAPAPNQPGLEGVASPTANGESWCRWFLYDFRQR